MSISDAAEDVKELQQIDAPAEDKADGDLPVQEEQKHDTADEQCPQQSPHDEEKAVKNKYGGLMRKKHPLISKDHERAFFDSADWALGKQGAQKPKGPLEALRPKLQPTQHLQHRSRRSVYAPTGDSEEDDHDHNSDDLNDQSEAADNSKTTKTDSEDTEGHGCCN